MAKETSAPEKKEKKVKEPEVPMVTSKMLADELGTKPATLRRFLRTLPQFQDGGYTRYKWPVGDKFLKDVKASFEKHKVAEKEKNAERLKNLKAKKDEDKGAKGSTGKKGGKSKKDEDDDEDGEELD